LIPLAEARARVLAGCRALAPAERALEAALGCVLAETVTSTGDIPPFANTAMDGYAVHAADTQQVPARLRVVGTLAAGAAPEHPVERGQALRIMTGAPFPAGADAVVMVERTRTEGDDVVVLAPAQPGDHVRPAGEDIAAGQEVFVAGTPLGPGHLGVLASIGREMATVVPPARVGVVSTGDELVVGAGRLEPGKIRDSNRPTLLALARQAGCEVVDLGVAPDDEAAIRAVLDRGLASCDALLTSGGVSMGEFDYVKKVLDEAGDMAWMQVAIKPAKPLAFGVVAGKPVFGLPGNPVSSMVSFELFARPGLRQMMGFGPDALDRPHVRAVADDDSLRRQPDGKVHFARVVCAYGDDGRYHIRSSGGQSSNLLRAMALANALAVLPDGAGPAPGDEVDVMLLS
jgi:molybdopterin molybdotransferase